VKTHIPERGYCFKHTRIFAFNIEIHILRGVSLGLLKPIYDFMTTKSGEVQMPQKVFKGKTVI
jgi:hypothetical protein